MSSKSMNYEIFLESYINTKKYYSVDKYNINIYVSTIIESLKKEHDFGCWFMFSSRSFFSLEYFSLKNNSNDEKLYEVEKFIFKNLPYVSNVSINKGECRINITFYEMFNPIKYVFYR